MADAWNVGFAPSSFPASQTTRPANETALLHEVIIQAVTERRVDVSLARSYDVQLNVAVRKVEASDGYKALLEKHSFSRADVSTLLDQQHLQLLPTVESSKHTTLMMVTGGPATGKSSLMEKMGELKADVYRDAAKINPDDYKPLLADPAIYGKNYADVAHEESSQLANKIMGRLEEKIAAGRAPHVVMDVVAANERRMNFAHQAGELVVITGTAPPEVTVPRAYERGEKPGGRAVPTEIVLDGARKVAATTPNIFDHAGVKFELLDTNVPFGSPSKSVAHLEKSENKQTLKISNPDTFIDFVERQNLNVNAHAPDQLFKPQDRSPQRIAEGLKAYTDKGVTLDFLNPNGEVAMTMSRDGVDAIKPLASARGPAFMPEIAVAATALLARQNVAEQKRPAQEEHLAERKAPVKTGAVYGGAVPAAIGVGMGAQGLYDAAQPNSSVRRDVDAGGAQAVAGGARVTAQAVDVTIGAGATIEGTRRALSQGSATVAGIANTVPEMGMVGKVATRTAIPLAITIGGLDAAAGIAEKNPERVAGAVGRTGGGIWGGIEGGAAAGALYGLLGGSPTGPGAFVSAGVGALGGAVVGGFIGEEGAKELTKKAMQLLGADNKPEPKVQAFPQIGPRPSLPMPTLEESKHLSADMMRARRCRYASTGGAKDW